MVPGALRGLPPEIGFTPREAVRWLAPRELLRTAAIVGASAVVAGYWDKREMQAALPAHPLALAADADGGLWLDYTADTGDGFHATYTVASLLAADRLDVTAPDGTTTSLPRGGALVLGGDEVYPTPSADGYEDRLRGPFRSALPAADPAPTLLAIPGNHDWYDGLTAFLRVFCQQRRIGGWRCVQTRSYWAVRLPQQWWLVGLDTQTGADIDEPQVAYFREHLSAHLAPGDGVVVCTAVPAWVHARPRDGGGTTFDSLQWFEENLVRHRGDGEGGREPTGASVRLWLSGDSHHYARYADASGRQAITCGLGGAYLAATHDLPEVLELPPAGSRVRPPSMPARFDLAEVYPPASQSRRMRWAVLSPGPLGLPQRNPGFWRLAGGVHAAAFLALAGVLGLDLDLSPADAVRSASVSAALGVAGQALVWFAALVAAVTLVPLVRGRRPRAVPAGFVAAAWQLPVACAALVAAVAVPWPSASTLPDWGLLGLCLVVSVAGTGLVASYAFALFVLTVPRGVVADWQMSAQAREDGKGFLRLRIRPDGALVVHPVVVDTVCRSWTTEPLAEQSDRAAARRVVPASALPQPRLVEAPVVVPRA